MILQIILNITLQNMVWQKLSWEFSLDSLVVLPTWVYHVYKGQLQSVAAKDLPQLDTQNNCWAWKLVPSMFPLQTREYYWSQRHAPSMFDDLIKISQSKTRGKNWDENREENPEHNWEHNLEQNYFKEQNKYLKNTLKIS